jgi:DNA-binding SARP family transcriptional activator
MTPDPLVPPIDAATLLTHLDTTGVSHLTAMLAMTRTLLDAWGRVLVPGPAAPPRVDDIGSPAPSPARMPAPDHVTELPMSVQMLDGFQLWIGSQPLPELARGKARAMLMYLLLNRRRPQSRVRLCRLFWPEAEPTAVRNNLHVTLHRLRRHLVEGHRLQHSDAGYQIVAPEDCWIDVEQFEHYAGQAEQADRAGQRDTAIGAYEIAMALYRCDLVDETEREPALVGHAQVLRDRLNFVLERLSTLREQGGDLHGCLRATQRHLLLDECNEAAHRRLMCCYARLGQPQLAERQFRLCERALGRQLGLTPSETTRALMLRIGARQPV